MRIPYYSQIFQFMEATHSGVTGGLVVAKHAEEESSTALVHVPIPIRLTEEEIAADWDLINNYVNVTEVPAQVKLYVSNV